MVANVDAMVRAGIEAYRGGKSAEARKLLEKAIELDDYNEQAWMWLSAVVETEEEKRTCLENVLVINPENEEAQRGLKMLGVESTSTSSTATSESETANPFTDTGMADFGDADFTADTGEDNWSEPPTATSSSSSVYQGPETSETEYDAWVDNLNLGTDNDQTENVEVAETNTFDSGNLEDMFGLDDSDDLFGTNDPFGSETQFDDDLSADSGTFTSGPFGGDLGLDSTPEPAPQAQSQPQVDAPAVVSPGAENIADDDNFFEELGSADFSGGDFIMGDDDFEDDGQPDFTPDELFSFIPDNISATRLPGVKQGVSIVSIVILVVLIAMNLGAIAFVVTSLS